MTKKTIWCLSPVENLYDPPDYNLSTCYRLEEVEECQT